ncbi:MAG: sigma 54-interacting transcriptional regulator [Desulfobulbaceae bacterium]|nr:sigma 54-interacting transcriptional regulator [Desulfobulbaceae bacterium]
MSQLDFSSFIDSFPQGVLLLDSRRKVITANRIFESFTGYTREAILGTQGEHVLRSSFTDDGNIIQKTIDGDETVTIEGNIINRNRKKIPIRFTISPVSLESGQVSGVAIFLEDISLLKDLDEKIHGFPGKDKILGHSQKMQEIFELLPIVARTDATLLILGETGTGKDLIAEAIHKASARSRHPFVKVNCGALPESLLESELFGHVRGAFTGANYDKPGMFRLAHGGTIFLTEIGDLPLPLQVKLLTVLDDKEFFPVGGSKKIKVDVRIITATHRNLRELVKHNRFREDLYYRLNVLRLQLPSLREREDDFRLLLDHFLREFAAGLNKNITGFSAETIEKLASYPFPGNVRELRNIVEYAVNICQGGSIEPDHLPDTVMSMTPGTPHPRPPESNMTEHGNIERTEIAPVPPRDAHHSPPPNGWEEMEKRMILEALARTRGRRNEAAKLLGWGRSTLWRKIKRYDLN